jgi:hypothetical protein
MQIGFDGSVKTSKLTVNVAKADPIIPIQEHTSSLMKYLFRYLGVPVIYAS